MKMKRALLITVLVLAAQLCACGRGKEADSYVWTVQEEAEKMWQVSDTLQFPADVANPKQMFCGQKERMYVKKEDMGCFLYILPENSQGAETKIALEYPMEDMLQASFLRGLFPDYTNEDNFIALWETGTDSEDKSRYELIQYNIRGLVQANTELQKAELEEYIAALDSLIQTEDGWILVANDTVITITKEGRVVNSKKVSVPNALLYLQEKPIFLEQNSGKTRLFDLSNGLAEEPVYEIPIAGDYFFISETGELYLSGVSGLYQCDLENKTAKLVLVWEETGLKYNTIHSIVEVTENNIAVFGYDNGGYNIRTIVPSDRVDEREVITLLGNQYEWQIQDRVHEFNESNKNYKIVVVDPREGMSDYADEDIQRKIQLLPTSADAPDLVDLSFVDHWSDYAEKGMFEDLMPYLNASSVLEESDYLPNIFASGKVGEKQIFIPYSFAFLATYGKEAYLGSGYGWTLEEVLKVSHSYENVSVFNTDPAGCLRYLLLVGKDTFIDFDTLQCDFEQPLFYDLLLTAAKSEYTEETIDEFSTIFDNIIEERALMETVYIPNPEFYLGYTSAVPGKNENSLIKLVLKGFPSIDGQTTGYAYVNGPYYGITSSSKRKEGAWQFIEYVQSYKDEFTLSGSFPAQTDWLIERTKDIAQNGFGNVELREYTEEDIETLLDIINNLKHQTRSDEVIMDIIVEEAQPYFEGWKSEEEVAKTIQSRVGLYLDEND